jgi:hypothetical protein
MITLRSVFLFTFLTFTSQAFSQTPDSLQSGKDSLQTTPAQAPSTTTAAPRQNIPKRTFREKFDVGIGTGFWINTRETFVEVAPIVAYRFPKALITGIGYRYIYRHDRIFDRDLNAYGPNVFARLNVTKRLYLWTEYETLKTEYLTENPGGETAYKSDDEQDSWFAGFGYMRSFGRKGRGGISFQALYNVLYENDDTSPYYFPVTYRVGYFF